MTFQGLIILLIAIFIISFVGGIIGLWIDHIPLICFFGITTIALLAILFIAGDGTQCRNTISKGLVNGVEVEFDGRECKYRDWYNKSFDDMEWISINKYTVREK